MNNSSKKLIITGIGFTLLALLVTPIISWMFYLLYAPGYQAFDLYSDSQFNIPIALFAGVNAVLLYATLKKQQEDSVSNAERSNFDTFLKYLFIDAEALRNKINESGLMKYRDAGDNNVFVAMDGLKEKIESFNSAYSALHFQVNIGEWNHAFFNVNKSKILLILSESRNFILRNTQIVNDLNLTGSSQFNQWIYRMMEPKVKEFCQSILDFEEIINMNNKNPETGKTISSLDSVLEQNKDIFILAKELLSIWK